jgi:hypothetical protein
MPEAAPWSGRTPGPLLGLLSVFPLLASGCYRFDDCGKYHTCPGDLIALAEREAGDAAEACAACLTENCREQEAECAVNEACNYGARCIMKSDPLAYQHCLTDLRQGGHSNGREENRPWEGAYVTDPFVTCAEQHCASACRKDERRWRCEPVPEPGERVTAELAVRAYTGTSKYQIVTDFSVRVCQGGPECEEEGWRTSEGREVLQLSFLNNRPETLYFELKSTREPAQFPRTLFYPGLLGSSGIQPVAVFLVGTSLVGIGNGILGFEGEVLDDRAQSLILPDSCVWDTETAAGLTFSLKHRELDLCIHARAVAGDPTSQAPCIWYNSSAGFPELDAVATEGWGGGVAGLEPGSYVLNVYDGDGELRSTRTLVMKAGAMTIARTWPLTRKENASGQAATSAVLTSRPAAGLLPRPGGASAP